MVSPHAVLRSSSIAFCSSAGDICTRALKVRVIGESPYISPRKLAFPCELVRLALNDWVLEAISIFMWAISADLLEKFRCKASNNLKLHVPQSMGSLGERDAVAFSQPNTASPWA